MLARILIRNIDPDELDHMLCDIERAYGVDIELEDTYDNDIDSCD